MEFNREFVDKMIWRLMIIALIGFLLGIFVQEAEARYPGDFLLGNKKAGAVYVQIMRNTGEKPPHDPFKLAASFEKVAKKYGLDPLLLSAMAAVESGYFVGAINSRTADYGIMQINARNIKHYKFSKERLLTDVPYSIEAGAIVLSWFKAKYAHKEKNWFCRYNVGVRKLEGALGRICKSYASKVRSKL